MSIDRSLKIKGALSRHRNVLSRAERIERLKDEELWSQDQSAFGLPKVANRKVRTAKKIKETPTEEAAAETPEAGTTETKES